MPRIPVSYVFIYMYIMRGLGDLDLLRGQPGAALQLPLGGRGGPRHLRRGEGQGGNGA